MIVKAMGKREVFLAVAGKGNEIVRLQEVQCDWLWSWRKCDTVDKT